MMSAIMIMMFTMAWRSLPSRRLFRMFSLSSPVGLDQLHQVGSCLLALALVLPHSTSSNSEPAQSQVVVVSSINTEIIPEPATRVTVPVDSLPGHPASDRI